MPKTLRIKDLAEQLGVTARTIHNMLNDGRIPVKPIDGTQPRRWSEDAVKAWLTGQGAE